MTSADSNPRSAPARPVIEKVRRHRLDNGLTVLTLEDRAVPLVATMVWYRVGSRYETAGQTGLSHLLEHMMFKGSSRFGKGEIDAVTTRYGGTNNAFTANDYTAYYFCFASDRWWPALEIESDRMHNARFDPREFELERKVVREELKTEMDESWGALRMAVERRAFARHPYGFPVLGRYRDLLGLTPARLEAHYRRFYCPANATLVIAGDFDTARVLERVEGLFGGIPAGRRASLDLPAEPLRERTLRLGVRRRGRLPRLLVALPAPSVREAEHYAMHVADKILGEGRRSRLYQRLLQQEAVVSNASCDFSDTYDPYLWSVGAELLPRVEPRRVEDVLFEELERLGREPPPDEELRRAKNQCTFAFLSSFESPLDQAVQLGLMETLHRFEYWNDYCERIREVQPDQVCRLAGRYFQRARAVIGTLTP